MHLVERLDETLERCALEAERLEVERHAALVEDPHHHALAVHRGNGGHAQVDFLALDAQLDAPVLGQAALRDVERRHDLHARDHRGRQAPRRRFGLVQHAVDAVAHDQAILERLDMDVGRARLECLGEQQVHEANDRGLGGEVLQVCDVAEVLLLVARGDVVHDLAHGRAPAPIQALERRLDLVGCRDVGAHALAGGHLHRGEDVRIGGVGDGEGQLVVVLAQRHDLRIAQELGRQALFHERQLGVITGLGQRQVELLGERVSQVATRDHTQAQQDHANLLARLALLQFQGTFEVRGIELAALDEDFADALRQWGAFRT